MASIVVVQSDDLAAWIGVAGVVVGVVLSTGLDWWRSRRAKRAAARQELLRAGNELYSATAARTAVVNAAGDAIGEPAWVLVVAQFQAAQSAAMAKIVAAYSAAQPGGRGSRQSCEPAVREAHDGRRPVRPGWRGAHPVRGSRTDSGAVTDPALTTDARLSVRQTLRARSCRPCRPPHRLRGDEPLGRAERQGEVVRRRYAAPKPL